MVAPTRSARLGEVAGRRRSGVALIAEAKAAVIPGKAHKNSNGAEWAPSAVRSCEQSLQSRAGPIPAPG